MKAKGTVVRIYMGISMKNLVTPEKITLSTLRGTSIVLDAPNHLYQFITAIRTRRGNLVKDSNNQVISHLLGLFHRTINLMNHNIKVIYVFFFDGDTPELKKSTRKKRRAMKEKARKLYHKATIRGNVNEMKKYAARASIMTNNIIQESKTLIRLLGLPVIEAPYEAEA